MNRARHADLYVWYGDDDTELYWYGGDRYIVKRDGRDIWTGHVMWEGGESFADKLAYIEQECERICTDALEWGEMA